MSRFEVGETVTFYDITGWEGWVKVGEEYKVVCVNDTKTMIGIDHPTLTGTLWIERFMPSSKQPSIYLSDELWDCPL